MSQKLTRIFTIIVISIATLSVLIGGTYFYENFLYTNPLEKTVEQMKAVEVFEVEHTKDRMMIKVQFNREDKLRPSFYQLLNEVEQVNNIDINNLVIKINNNFDQEIASFMQASKLPIYEALSTGEYTELPEKLASLAENEELTYELDLDQQYIFLTAYKDDQVGHQVIKRTETPFSVFTTMGEEYI
ncbi:MAG: hypothetical protein ACOX2X_04060 [Peptococcia bacterium]|jgi:hypothetical protein